MDFGTRATRNVECGDHGAQGPDWIVHATCRLDYHRCVSGGQDRDEERAWLRATLRERGLFGTLRYYAAGSYELVRDLTPQRRRSRYGDIDYDFDHGVDTTW